MAGPRHSHRAPPKASAAAIHSALEVAAARSPTAFLVMARSTTMSRAKTANVPAQRGQRVIAGDVPPRPGPAPRHSVGSTWSSGAVASNPAGTADPHCSQDPKLPAGQPAEGNSSFPTSTSTIGKYSAMGEFKLAMTMW